MGTLPAAGSSATPGPSMGVSAGMGALPGAAGMNAAGDGAMTGINEPPSSDAEDTNYHDPGTGPWEMGTPQECKLDPALVTAGENLAVFRYGKLCHIQGGNTSIANWSATKTLGGVLAGRAAYLVKDVPRSGPGTGPILHEDKLSDWGISTSGLNADALLSHVMSMTAYNTDLAYGAKVFSYDTYGTREISRIVEVAMVAAKQVMGLPTTDVAFMQEQVFDKLGMADSSWPGSTIGYGWIGSLEDMGRVGVMLAHDGWYGGGRFMEASWVYRMSHPAHEDANTAYGQLAWLSNRGGAACCVLAGVPARRLGSARLRSHHGDVRTGARRRRLHRGRARRPIRRGASRPGPGDHGPQRHFRQRPVDGSAARGRGHGSSVHG
jgi:hypothetical protein